MAFEILLIGALVFLGYLRAALPLGVIVGAIASAVVLPMMQGLNMSQRARTILTFEAVAVFDNNPQPPAGPAGFRKD